jgi:hypothetical protein
MVLTGTAKGEPASIITRNKNHLTPSPPSRSSLDPFSFHCIDSAEGVLRRVIFRGRLSR